MASANKGRFVWYEYMPRDAKAGIAFYGDVIGWKTQPFQEGGGDYTMWVGSQGPLGGAPEDLPSHPREPTASLVQAKGQVLIKWIDQ